MTDRYRIEIRQSTTTPIIIEADTQEEAIERVLAGFGDTGDQCHEEPEIIATRLLGG